MHARTPWMFLFVLILMGMAAFPAFAKDDMALVIVMNDTDEELGVKLDSHSYSFSSDLILDIEQKTKPSHGRLQYTYSDDVKLSIARKNKSVAMFPVTPGKSYSVKIRLGRSYGSGQCFDCKYFRGEEFDVDYRSQGMQVTITSSGADVFSGSSGGFTPIPASEY